MQNTLLNIYVLFDIITITFYERQGIFMSVPLADRLRPKKIEDIIGQIGSGREHAAAYTALIGT